MAATPVVAGWLFQVTPFSVQLAATCHACSVRPFDHEGEKMRNVADSTTQPAGGVAGRLKRTRARRLLLGPLDITLRIESVPLLSLGLP